MLPRVAWDGNIAHMYYLTLATVILGLLVSVKGALALWGGKKFTSWSRDMLYNRPAALVVWTLAVAWTLWEVLKLGPADFGSFKVPLFLVFLGVGISSVWMLRDYLIVRGACVLALYASWWMLKAAYLRPEGTRLIFVTVVYLMIVGALYLAVAPWRARDIVDALEKRTKLRKWVGYGYVALGFLLLGVAVSYRFA